MSRYLTTVQHPWRVLDELTGGFPLELFDRAWRRNTANYPRIEYWEDEAGFTFQAEVAGVEPDVLEVDVDENVLTIKGARKNRDGEVQEFQRSLTLPAGLENEGITANTKNGLLTIVVPRHTSAKRKVEIERL